MNTARKDEILGSLETLRIGLDEYKRRHRAVWPETLDALLEPRWKNYSLFLREDGLPVGYHETEDFKRARAGMTRSERTLAARDERFFVEPSGIVPDRAIQPLEEVFHLP